MPDTYLYLFITVILLVLELVYFKIADRFNIIDKPNHRSSHTAVTIRGGGIIYPFALILYAAFFGNVSPLIVAGILAAGIISFIDDIKTLSSLVRLCVHVFAVSTLVYVFYPLEIYVIILLYILTIGIINAYNFMDGINGITGTYSLVSLASLWYYNTYITSFTDNPFIICPILASLVFLFFNFRTKARCFAGDVGSVAIGFWIITLLFMAIMKTQSLNFILFLSVYGVDSIFTIIHRLMLKQNIFEAHRLHFYQIMANNKKMPHLVVSVIYMVLQLGINLFIISSPYLFWQNLLIVCLPLAVIYVLGKYLMMRPERTLA